MKLFISLLPTLWETFQVSNFYPVFSASGESPNGKKDRVQDKGSISNV